jgi:SAM-dependent methyltransferase
MPASWVRLGAAISYIWRRLSESVALKLQQRARWAAPLQICRSRRSRGRWLGTTPPPGLLKEMRTQPMDTPPWFLDQVAHAGREHLDPAYVPTYDEKAGTDPAEDLALLRAQGLNETRTLVDLGAGTGTFALAAAPFCRRVVAVDVSPVMINRLREKAAQQGVENIECVQAGFLTYAHQGAPADFVYSRHA